MPVFFIDTVDSAFQSRDQGQDYASPEDAMAAGLLGALAIIGDEVQQGRVTSAVDVRVQRADGKAVLRSVIALSVSSLKVDTDQVEHPTAEYIRQGSSE